jgi:hypothetical protein
MDVAWRERFVRCYRGPIGRSDPGWIYGLEASLVAGVSPRDGPGRGHVAYLGYLEVHSRAAETEWVREARRQFWDGAGRVLDGLGERLTAAERRAIVAKLAARVARP